jgi:hypothetical protein
MMKEQITQAIDALSDQELQQVLDFLAFLKFRARRGPTVDTLSEEVGQLYQEGADEDRDLAEEGMAEYGQMLQDEDVR